ncbi:uncharacterized protein C8A04DRAFT_25931 [Dichotomopilus funicola]|uniref:YMC020W-like alpha/beta hydrolase domain-containing protein n=1 Tax=Dichotomopilus funicola TaxID=1934379 RepID=A0AAN6V7Y4_9PEZI|nr:hypothetical protein C8A04DRAFT_25931 [Dichotomopilus funicola]
MFRSLGSRKRVKPNPTADPTTPTTPTTATPTTETTNPSSTTLPESTPKAATPNAAPVDPAASDDKTSKPQTAKSGKNGEATAPTGPGSKQLGKPRSWYGSWPRVPKSAPSTQVARETILASTSAATGTADFSRFEQTKPYDTRSIGGGSVLESSLPKTHTDLSTPREPRAQQPQEPPMAPVSKSVAKPPGASNPDNDTEMTDAGQPEDSSQPPPEQPATTTTAAEQAPTAEPTPQRPASGWFGGWLGGSTPAGPPPAKPTDTPTAQSSSREADVPPPAQAEAPEVEVSEVDKEAPQPTPEMTEVFTPLEAQDKAAGGYGAYGSAWLWSWSGRSTATSADSQPKAQPSAAGPEAAPSAAKEPEDVVMEDAPAAEAAPESPAPAPKAGSTWAFWSRDSGSAPTKQPAEQKPEQGHIAVMGESSETHPQKANQMEFKSSPVKEPPLKSGKKEELVKGAATPSREAPSKSNKRARPKSMEGDDKAPERPSTPKVGTTTKTSAPKTPVSATKVVPLNLVLPSFDGTYKLKENPSILKQITQLLLRTQQPAGDHVYLTKETPKIKRAIAIGVHGLFPANYLRPMIGQPTGTSIKFANHTADAIRRWADSHGCSDCEIEKVALEGEGRIGERVENLWKLLLNWIDTIRKADLIIIGCHSQGVPVSIMLLAKLIELGVVASARVGVCAMAGVSLGPFPDYRSSMGILMGSAAELWEFADPYSEVSKRLEASVKVALKYGARITYIGSIDDQLVPLESAIYAPAHHPYIYRAVFIDGRIHAPDFIAHLVGFALKLRNLGVSDHGLIRELSTPLAGSLYSGEGHSRLYDDGQVYDLSVTHALETTDTKGACEVGMHYRRDIFGGADNSSNNNNGTSTNGTGMGNNNNNAAAATSLSNPNPYHLPWIMRGMLEEDFVKTELSAETAELVRQFDDWKPVTKALKDVKYRLEAVRSKL